MDPLHRGGRYVLKARRYLRPGVNQMPGEVVDLTHDEAVLALAQGTAVPDVPVSAVPERPIPDEVLAAAASAGITKDQLLAFERALHPLMTLDADTPPSSEPPAGPPASPEPSAAPEPPAAPPADAPAPPPPAAETTPSPRTTKAKP